MSWFRNSPVARARSVRQLRPSFVRLEDRVVLSFNVVAATVYGPALAVVVDFSGTVNASTVQASDLLVDNSPSATGVTVVDGDTVRFTLPALAAGNHTLTIDASQISDNQGAGLTAHNSSFNVAAAQYAMKHAPRLQPGNAPLVGFPGSDLDRVDVLWQTISAGSGTQDSFTVEYRAVGAPSWQAVALNAAIDTGVETRIVDSASIAGLNWNSSYEYRLRHRRADVVVDEFQSTFRTRLQAGDSSPFTFAAYGDSASGAATGFRAVQSRINAVNPAFAVLLGDNVYSAGSHSESDSRFDPTVNPEAAAWMAGHVDYLGLGNHDVGTGSGLPSEQNFSVPIPVAGVTSSVAPPATERNEHSFSWDYGNVHFVTFDTNSYTDPARLDGLLKWVVADLTASTARWKIVYGHHPLAGVPDKPEGPADNYYQQVVNRLKAAGVDLFMTGHSHTYSWTYPLTGEINNVATYANHGANDHFIAGEGLPQLVSGVGGVELRPGSYSSSPFIAAGFTSETAVASRFGFSQVEVAANQLTVKYVAADDGAVLDSFVITKDANPQTVSFQQGVGGYAGTVDGEVYQSTPTQNYATAASINVDANDGAGFVAQGLLRFDNLFGGAAGQIPTNAQIRSATLQLQVTNGSTNNVNLHRMINDWSATVSWNSFGSGLDANDIEAVAAPDTSSGASQIGVLSFNVLPSLLIWKATPASNHGWALLPTGTDGVDFHSSEGATPPKLIVTYVVPTGANDAPVAVADSAITNVDTGTTIAVLANDIDPNGDNVAVVGTTPPAHGSIVVNADGTITFTPTTGFFGSDSFTYTVGDGRGGSATATVLVTVARTLSFQQGVNGYAGTRDTYLQEASPAANNAAAASLKFDTDNPTNTSLKAQALLRFDNLFGAGAGQIPTTANILSATLQLNVTNSGNAANLHRMRGAWSDTGTWSSFTNGIDDANAEFVSPFDVTTGAIAATGLLSINVLASLQAWLAAPATSFGWAFLPTGTDGVDFDSSEGTTKPKLTVVYSLPNVPTIAAVAPFVGPTSGGNTVVIVGADLTGATNVKFGGVDAVAFTVNSASQITATAPAGSSTVNVAVTTAGGTSNTAATGDDYTYAVPAITSVVVNGGTIVAKNKFGETPNLANQNSVVEQILVTFNQMVKLDANAFTITSLFGSVTAQGIAPSPDGAAVTATGVSGTGDNTVGFTQYVLTFNAGSSVNSFTNASPGNTFTTLKDGLFQLNTVGAHVKAGASDTAANRTDNFWALYGAVNAHDVTVSSPLTLGGNKLLVDGIALGEMYQTFGSFQNVAGPPAYNVAYDSNLDGIVDGIDLGKMYANFGTIWQF